MHGTTHLILQFTNGTVHIKATWDKTYELVLMPLQAAVLLPFNDGGWGVAGVAAVVAAACCLLPCRCRPAAVAPPTSRSQPLPTTHAPPRPLPCCSRRAVVRRAAGAEQAA